MLLSRVVYPLVASIAESIDRKRGWDSLGRFSGAITLFGLRFRLRQRNLYDTAAIDPPERRDMPTRVTVRTVDGADTDVCDVGMGTVGMYFGRNGPAFARDGELPDPDVISRELLARRQFLPATSLNLLAAAWVQFEVHDWMQHRTEPCEPPADEVEQRLVRAPGSTARSPRFVSGQTHWWDASQLYGASAAFVDSIRVDRDSGRVKVGDDLLEAIENSIDTGSTPVPNLWIGLALLHDLFAREHNAICDAITKGEPRLKLSGDDLFDKARLINAAVMAKIHTVEWTPAVIAHPTTAHAIRASWWGVLGERANRIGHVGSGEVLSGIPGSRTRHDGVRYSLTEEFVAVYRMHPLIPDDVTFRRARDDALISDAAVPFEALAVAAGPRRKPRDLLNQLEYENALYSLGVANPGSISLQNYPEFLRALPVPPKDEGAPRGAPLDLAALDIKRMRECAVPLYNDFRRLFRLRPAGSFLELAAGDEGLARSIEDVYGELDRVDLMVGLFAERKPAGFAFSDTAFRVFLLMAARRLRSDRFFTTDYTAGVYTATGLRWIRDRTLSQMLAEHHPALRPVLEHVDNVFTPWRPSPSAS